jgi:hypothetical protein
MATKLESKNNKEHIKIYFAKSKNNNVEVYSKVKSLITIDCEIAKFIPPLFTMRSQIRHPQSP